MSDLSLYFLDRRVGQKFSRGVQRQRGRVLASMRGTAGAMRDEIEAKVKADIRRASPAFARSKRWVPGFHAKVTEGGGTIRISATHDVPYFIVFARPGGTDIHGKPMLWIPLDFARDAHGVMARDYPGKLFRVDRPGKAPLLLASGPFGADPKYFGKEKVHLPQKFNAIRIIRDIAKKSRETYRKQFRRNA
jgi:hypothetical protein